jgi:predicted Zn-dependent protease
LINFSRGGALRVWVCALGLLAQVPASAQTPGSVAAPAAIKAPAAVALYLHHDVLDDRFMPLLVARLTPQLAVPVSAGRFELDMRPHRSWTQLLWPMDAVPVMEDIARRIDWAQPPGVTRIFIVMPDIRLKPARYNFAVSVGSASTPFQLSMVSLARLQVLDANGRDKNPDKTAERTAKLIVKNIARLAGYSHSQRCVFAFPNSLAELDALPHNFCEPDLSALVQAGIARRPP